MWVLSLKCIHQKTGFCWFKGYDNSIVLCMYIRTYIRWRVIFKVENFEQIRSPNLIFEYLYISSVHYGEFEN